MKIRKAIFANSWYPGNAVECEKEIQTFLKDGYYKQATEGTYVGGIVPHAGWFFSGSIACNVIYCLKQSHNTDPDVVVVFGMHLHEASDNYIMTQGGWETPFGPISIEQDLAEALVQRHPFRIETTQYYQQDNTIELQLPFIKYFFPNARLVPMGVSPTSESLKIGHSVAELSREMQLRPLIIGSTDLTHYGVNYGFVPKGTGPKALEWVRNENDQHIIDAMVAMDPQQVINEARANQNACCAGAAATAIAAVKALGATQAHALAYASSYDKSPGSSFVGYAGIVFK